MLLKLKSAVVGTQGVRARAGDVVDSSALGISDAQAAKMIARKQADSAEPDRQG